MNKQQLASKIWESANKMRSKIEANEYKDYILGFIFYKFLSDKELKYLKENDYEDADIRELTEEDEDAVKDIQTSIGYFISYENLFSTWLEMGSDFDVDNVRTALSAFTRLISESHKKVFNKIFDTLQSGLSKLGDSSKSQTKAVSDLIYLIKDIPMDGKQDYDVLGFVYEYLISNFAANAGKKAGEFYTPHEVSVLMSEIVAEHLKDRDKIEIYDPTSGSGSLLINIGKSLSKYMDNSNGIKYYAQELKENTYNLTRMNLVMRGIIPSNIYARNGDTLEDDWPYFDDADPIASYDPLYVDAVVSNPPYSQNWNPSGKEMDPRYAGYGIAPKSKADYAFLLHDLYHLKPDGIMNIVLPHGVLFRGGEEGEIRKNLIENNKIDAIIGLPSNIFFGTGIPTIVMVLKQKRTNDDVLIIDASKGFIKEGKNNKLRDSDIKKIVDTFKNRLSIDKYSKVVSRDEIRQNDYNLNIPRYVDSSEKAESWDIYALMFGGIPENELSDYNEYWNAFPTLRDDLYSKTGSSYYGLNTDDVKETIKNNKDVRAFIEEYKNAFNGFDEALENILIKNIESINISMAEILIGDEIFRRIKDKPLVNAYEAYQLFSDEWSTVSVDLEIIQTEGFEATKKVDPNIVSKKKDGKDVEVQDGWAGHVIPFSLVQDKILYAEKKALSDKENRLLDIKSLYEELLEEFNEDEKEMDFITEDRDAFVNSEVIKASKNKELEEETLAKLKKVVDIIDEEKKLKKEIKTLNAELENETKKRIEELTDTEVIELLKDKWITPIVKGLDVIPNRIIESLSSKMESLVKKYELTFSDVEKEIAETEKALRDMLDDIEGSEEDLLGLKELKKLLGGN
ncbi:type I restriction-modification protein subunit M [Eubacterium sulci ATCC 35585]|nr:type I restriction-modification protein subunit M [Eubacterium sulci ATCC 35585]EUC77982.1 type I restriction-modification system, M subunit [Eubacterium sulci ATCC 35585]